MTSAQYRIDVCAAAFGRALKFSGGRAISSLHQVNSVYVEPGERVTLQATNGAIAYVEEDATATADAPAILRVSPSVTRFLRAGNRVRVMADGQLRVTRQRDGRAVYVEPEEAVVRATFPAIANVMGDLSRFTPGLANDMDTDYLRLVLNTYGRGCAVRCYSSREATRAPLFLFEEVPGKQGKAFALVMPRKSRFVDGDLSANLPQTFAKRIAASRVKVAA